MDNGPGDDVGVGPLAAVVPWRLCSSLREGFRSRVRAADSCACRRGANAVPAMTVASTINSTRIPARFPGPAAPGPHGTGRCEDMMP